jgi:signal transduction histidine kinase
MTLRTRPHVMLAAAGAAFTAAYYALVALGASAWLIDALLALPAGAALALHVRRALSTPGRSAWFWRLTSLGLALWVTGEVLWSVAEFMEYDPSILQAGQRGFPLALDVLFVGFLAPFLGAMALRPHPRHGRLEPVAMTDAALICAAIGFVFLRLVFLPFQGAPGPSYSRFFLVGLLAFLLALVASAQWRWVVDPEWRTIYGCLGLAALIYGALNSVASGFARELQPPGTLADLAWIIPFVLLAAAALPAGHAPRPAFSSSLIVVLAGAGPVALDGLLGLWLPSIGLPFEPRPFMLVSVSAVMALGCLVRLLLEERASHLTRREERGRADESRRAGRLQALASLSASLVEDLERAMAALIFQARSAAPHLGDKAERVLEQAQRAQEIVRGMVEAFRLARPAHRQAVDVGLLLEETVHSAFDDGPSLHVRLEGTRRLPPVWGDPGALGAAFLHLIRNAAQASPGGRLTISATNDTRELTLRFVDDGPGVPAEVGPHVFDPFFTTRPVGEGLGLGLTQVHFIARDHGGSIVLQPSASGATFTVRLPVRERRTGQPVQPPWPLSVAVLAATAAALVLAIWPDGPGRVRWSEAWQVASALGAAAALAGASTGRTGRARLFWALLALGPLLGGLPAVLSATGALDLWREDHVTAELFLGASSLAWAGALLVRADRPRPRGSPLVPWLGGLAVAVLLAHAYLFAFVLPGATGGPEHLWRARALLAHGVIGSGLTLWAVLLLLRTPGSTWRWTFGRLTMLLGAWAVGNTVAGLGFVAVPRGGGLADLGVIVPNLLLAAFAVTQSLRESADTDVVEAGAQPAVEARGASRWWLALASLLALDLLASSAAAPALSAARGRLTQGALITVGLLLAARETLRTRERGAGAPPATSRVDVPGEPPLRLLRLVASAIYELSGQLSGISTLSRLLYSDPALADRLREDARRVQERADVAGRIVRNLISALPGAATTAQRFSLNRLVQEVVELRQADLVSEGIELRVRLAPDLPVLWLSVQAIRQVLLSCVDSAALLLRATAGGVIEIATAADGDHLVTRIHERPSLSGGDVRRLDADVGLSLAREVVAQHGGALSGREAPEGGTEIMVRLPVIAPPERESPPAGLRAVGRS